MESPVQRHSIVVIAGLFLTLTQHKYSAILLLVATTGGLVLNGVLKLGFERPRPTIFIPAVHTVSSSFYPSDVVAGVLIGFAWAGFCMATLEAIQRFALRRAPKILEDEKAAPGGAGS